jgi:hypothetical protein
MTTVESAADLQEQARQRFRESQAAELPMTGFQLGNAFGRSDRWGRDRIAEVKAADDVIAQTAVIPLPEVLPEVERQPVAEVAAVAEPVAAAELLPPGVSVAVQWITRTSVATVAAVAAAASYAHMFELAHHAGEQWRSWLLPLSVDGLIIAASMTLLVRKRQGQAGGLLAWSAMWVGVLVSLGANIAAVAPTLESRLIAAWPPLALLYGYELLMKQVKSATKNTD